MFKFRVRRNLHLNLLTLTIMIQLLEHLLHKIVLIHLLILIKGNEIVQILPSILLMIFDQQLSKSSRAEGELADQHGDCREIVLPGGFEVYVSELLVEHLVEELHAFWDEVFLVVRDVFQICA